MRRRDIFSGVLGGAAASWPLAARAQQKAIPVVGFINSVIADNPDAPNVEGFLQGVKRRRLYRTAKMYFEYRFADGTAGLRVSTTGLPAMAAELVRRRSRL